MRNGIGKANYWMEGDLDVRNFRGGNGAVDGKEARDGSKARGNNFRATQNARQTANFYLPDVPAEVAGDVHIEKEKGLEALGRANTSGKNACGGGDPDEEDIRICRDK